jgi:hypothetical protein
MDQRPGQERLQPQLERLTAAEMGVQSLSVEVQKIRPGEGCAPYMQGRGLTMIKMTKYSGTTPSTGFNALALLAAAAGSMALVACAGHDDAPGIASDDPVVSSEQEAYSDAECQATTADASGVWDAFVPYNNTSPTTYGKASAFKSYVWDLKPTTVRTATPPDVLPTLTLANLPSSLYDTAAECTALSFNRRLYVKVGTGFQMYGEAFAHGQWDNDLGCALPRHIGPDLFCNGRLVNGQFVCSSPAVGTSMTVRVCVSARDVNGNTIGVAMHMAGRSEIRSDSFGNPQMRVNSSWLPILANNDSAAGYCAKRFERLSALGAFTTKSSPAFPYASYNQLSQTWTAPGGAAQPVLQTVSCDYPLSH